jgi:hypothetical protein
MLAWWRRSVSPPLPAEASIEDVKVRIRECYRNPNVRNTRQVVLKEGPRTFRIATLFEIVDPETSEFHHWSLKIDSIDRRKSGWFGKAEKSIRLESGDPDEIHALLQFLQAALSDRIPATTGEIHIIGAADYQNLEQLLDVLPNLATSDRLELLKTVLGQLGSDASDVGEFIDAFGSAPTATLQQIGIAARVVEYKRAFEELRALVDDSRTSESQLQQFLARHPWAFGSEYSQLVDRRTWTRDDQLDFMLRRTVDDYLEIVEIKTPFKEPLLLYDKSHDSYYPSAVLSKVVGQVMRYVDEVDRSRDSILAKDGFDALKVRARIIIGTDGSDEHQAALRNLNSHLHRVEILTFDQLLRIAERVVGVFEEPEFGGPDDIRSDDIPF